MTTPKTHVYRSGVVATPAERGCEAQAYTDADAARPAGHPSRVRAIFAAPTLEGVARWVGGNAMVRSPDIKVRQITVNPDTAMVYNVQAWERASSLNTPAGYEAFWATGMTLTDWLAADLDGAEWEVILNDADVLGVRPVSDARVLAAVTDDFQADQLRRAMKRHRLYVAR